MLKLLPRWSLALIVPGLLFLALVTASFVDTASHSDGVARNVRLGDEMIGGFSEDELRVHVLELAARYAETPIELEAPDTTILSTTAELGLAIDVEKTVADALDAGQGGSAISRPFSWLDNILAGSRSEIYFLVDNGKLDEALFDQLRTEPVDPTLIIEDGQLTVSAGSMGQGVDAASLLASLPDAAAAGGYPLKATVSYTVVPPARSLDDVELLRQQLRSLLAKGLTVTVNEIEHVLTPATLESWVIPFDNPEGLTWELDSERALADLEVILKGEIATSSEATFIVEEGEVKIVAADGGRICCDDSAPDVIELGLRARTSTPTILPLRNALAAEGLEAAEALGIIELVGEFTTNHKCCENRVDNIQRFAAIMQGYVIPAGEEVSLNGYVGKRTREKGFVSAGVIDNGIFKADVGGGISQFATTIFNAAFFGGLDFGEYQSHSIYISRYPYGREATINYQHPDLVIKNTTPYAVLIWPTWTDTSITVQLYSTKYAVSEQTSQTRGSSGACTRVTTNRSRTYPDGSVVEDHVTALYRPGVGLDCAGNSTEPTTTTTTDPNATTTTTTDPNATTTTIVATTTTTIATTTLPTTTTTTVATTSAATTTTTTEP